MKLQALGVVSGATGVGIAISTATNATPIVITLNAGHGQLEGARLAIQGVTGNTHANGIWTLFNVGATAASLKGSVGNGTYGGSPTVAVVMDKTPFMRGHSAVAAVYNASGGALFQGTALVEGSNQADDAWQDSPAYSDAALGQAIGAVGIAGVWEYREVQLHRYMRVRVSAWTAGGVKAVLLA